MQARMVEQMDISLSEMVGEVLHEVEQTTLSPEHLYNSVEGNLKLNLGIELILWNFTGLQTAVLIWFGMMSTTIVLFCCFSLWANKRVCVAAN
uniref:Uncharacterized protein n=1 Tax=Timema cristinae TaxID=61476 RepID=A0A7R9CX30_TIMCR|nr:unnamed protein product [Timema cristinae]